MFDLETFTVSLPGGINQSSPTPGERDLEELENFGIFRNRIGLRPPFSLIATIQDDQGTPADVDEILDITDHEGNLWVTSWSASEDKVYLHSMQVDGTSLTLEAVVHTGVVSAPTLKMVSFTGGTADSGVSRLYISDYNQNLDTKFWNGAAIVTLTEDLDSSSSAENIQFSLMIPYKFHLWGTGFFEGTTTRGEMLRFTQPGAIPATDIAGGTNPKEWFAADHRSVGRRGDKIVALSKAGDRLLVFQKRATHAISGSGVNTWVRQELSDVTGCVGPHAVTSVDNRIAYFWASDGPYRTDGNTLQYIGDPIRQFVAESEADELKTQVGYSPDDGLIYFLVSLGGADTYDVALLFDHRQERWMKAHWLVGADTKVEFGSIEFLDAAAAPGPEAAPNTPTATAVSDTGIDITWVNGDVNVNTETHIYRSTSSGFTPNDATNKVVTLASGVTTYSDMGLTQITEYFYKIKHFRNSAHSSATSEVSDTTWLAEPESVGLAGLTDGLAVSGTNKADAACIRIERRVTGGSFGLVTTLCNNIVTVKPTISSPEVEYDANLETEADLATVATWDDQTVNANDATSSASPQMLKTGWDASNSGIRLLSADVDLYSYDGSVFDSTNFTLFSVIRATDISAHLPIWGSNSASSFPRRVSLFIRSDGSVVFTFGSDPYDLRTAAGVITEGEDYIITARFSTTDGMLIRVNGTQVGIAAGQTTAQIDNSAARLGRVTDTITGGIGSAVGVDKLFAFLSGYSIAVSAGDITTMESYLANVYSITLGGFAIDDVFSYDDTGLTCGTRYFYRTRAEKSPETDSEWTANVLRDACEASTAPTAPSALTAASASTTSILLGWTDNSDNEDGFDIHRSTDGGSTYSLLDSVSPATVAYTDTGLASATEFFYKVRAKNSVGNSAFTSAANATTASDLTAPDDLALTVVSASEIDLTWTDTAGSEDSWQIHISDDGGSTYTFVSIGEGLGSYSATGLSAAHEYFFKVRAHGQGVNGSFSNIENATTPGSPPTAPTMTSVIKDAGSPTDTIDIIWVDNSSNEDGFEVWRAPGATPSGYILVTTESAGVETFEDTGLEAGTQYNYYIVAKSTLLGDSSPSAVGSDTTDGGATVPSDPSDLAATGDDADLDGAEVSAVDLTWTDNSTDEDDFQIERCTGAACTDYSVIATLPSGTASYRDTGVTDDETANTSYRYRIRARNSAGNSDYDGPVTATVEPQVTVSGVVASDTGFCNGPVPTPRLQVQWSNGDITGLVVRAVQRSKDSGSWVTLQSFTSSPENVLSYTDNAVNAGQSYRYRIMDSHGFAGENTGIFTSDPSTTDIPTIPECSGPL